jgi:hypothetical protein
LIIIGISTQSQASKSTHAQKTYQSYQAYYQASRDLHSDQEKRLYDQVPKQKDLSKKITKLHHLVSNKPKPTKVVPPPQKEEYCLFNLYSLFLHGKKENPLAYQLLENLLFVLYDNTTLIDTPLDEKYLHYFIDEIISAAQIELKKQEKALYPCIYLEKLKLKNKEDHAIFYRMLKGTKHYQLESKQGFPSLLDFVYVSSQEKELISVPYASKELLYALFNKEIAISILDYQMKDNSFSPITKDALENLLSQHFSTIRDFPFWPLLDFSKKGKKMIKPLKGEDEKKEITLYKKLN